MGKNLVSFKALDGTLLHVKSFADDDEGILIHSDNDVFMFCLDLEDQNFSNFSVRPFIEKKRKDVHMIKLGGSMIKVSYDEAVKFCNAVIDLIESNSEHEDDIRNEIKERYCNK